MEENWLKDNEIKEILLESLKDIFLNIYPNHTEVIPIYSIDNKFLGFNYSELEIKDLCFKVNVNNKLELYQNDIKIGECDGQIYNWIFAMIHFFNSHMLRKKFRKQVLEY